MTVRLIMFNRNDRQTFSGLGRSFLFCPITMYGNILCKICMNTYKTQ